MSVLTWFTVFWVSSWSGLALPQHTYDKALCEISASVSIADQGNGYKSVEITIENNTSGLKYYFFDERNNILSYDFDKNKLLGVSAGNYYCLIVQNKNCHTKIEFEI